MHQSHATHDLLRRLDCILEPSKSKVIEEHKRLKGQSPAYTHKCCNAREAAVLSQVIPSGDSKLEKLDAYIRFLENFRNRRVAGA